VGDGKSRHHHEMYVALLRAVNVGGTGKLPMSTLKQICEEVGLKQVRTYIASGNIVFKSDAEEAEIKSALEGRLRVYAGKPVGVLVRSASEMAAVLARNPFVGKPGNRTVALFVDDPLPADALDYATVAARAASPGRARNIHFLWQWDGGFAPAHPRGECGHRPQHEHGREAGRDGYRALIIAGERKSSTLIGPAI